MKKFLGLAIIVSVLTGTVFAQSLPGDGFASAQNTATNGRIRSFADDFIRPDSFQNVKVDKWFGMASFQSNLRAALGWAARIGADEEKAGTFLGLFYGGSAWAGLQPKSTTEIDGVKYFNPTASISGNPYNQLAILLGFAKMGFRLSFISTYNLINQKDFSYTYDWDDDSDPDTPDVLKTDKYKSLKKGSGLLSPQIAWSMSSNLVDGIGIRPWATFDLSFNNNFDKQEKDGDNNVTINRSVNYIQPEFQFGLGGVTIANKNSWRTSFDFEYRLRMRFYNNEYNDSNGKVAKIKGLNNNGTFTENSWMDHRIRPIFSTQWNGEKLRLRSKLDLNVLLTSVSTAPQTDDNGTLKKNGDVTDAFTFGFNPDLQLAAQWQVSEKFFVNIGGRVNLTVLNVTTTNKERYSNGAAVPNSKSKTTDVTYGTNNQFSNQLTLGVTINATKNLFLEAVVGGGTARLPENKFDIFSTTDGPFSFGSILIGLKF